MEKVVRNGARAWHYNGKFIFALMLLTMPSSTATRLSKAGGGSGASNVVNENSLRGANYLIDAKHAVEYGTRFTKTLVHHLEVHGVNAKHETRSGMHRLLDNVLDEMRGAMTTTESCGGKGSTRMTHGKEMATAFLLVIQMDNGKESSLKEDGEGRAKCEEAEFLQGIPAMARRQLISTALASITLAKLQWNR